jgi:PST family polysaccharide transporter
MHLKNSYLSSTIKKYSSSNISKNIGWLFFDRIFRLGIGLIVGVWVARYLGPVSFGKWNYAIALTSLLSTFALMGLDSLIVRDIIDKPNDKLEILGTSLFIRVIGSSVVTIISCLIVFLTDKKDSELLIIVFLTSFSYVFLSFDVIDFYFQSRVESKYTVLAKFIAFILCSSFRVIALLYKMPLIVFVALALVEVFLGACLLIFFYVKKTQFNPINWSINFTFFKQKLIEAWPLILSGMVIMIYMRIDQIMLKQLIDEKAVGIYSAAVRISELWYVIPMAISTSVYPNLIMLKGKDNALYLKRFEQLYSVFFIISFGIGVLVTIFSSNIIGLLYGHNYYESAFILKINIWAGVFVFLGVASSNYMVIENLNKLSFYRTLLGAILNVLLNFILIPKYSGAGAAIATLISYAVAGYFSIILFPATRPLFRSMSKAIFNSFRISNYLKNN